MWSYITDRQLGRRPWERFRELSRQKKLPWFRVRIGSTQLIVVNKVNLATQVFVQQSLGTASRHVSTSMQHMSSQNVPPPLGSSPWNDATKKKRTAVASMLGKAHLHQFEELIRLEVDRAISALGQSQGKDAIDPFDILKIFSLNQSLGVTWGLVLDPKEEPDLTKEIIEVEGYIEHARYPLDTLEMLPLAWLWMPWLPSRYRMTQQMHAWTKRRAAYLEELERRFEAAQNDGTGRPCMSTFLLSGETRAELSASERNSVLISLLSAGLDAITWSTYWLLCFLAENPNLQQELADTVCSAGTKDLELLDSMVRESLRYFTVNRLSIPRVTYQPVRIGEATIPAGTTVIMNAWALNRDPDVWDHPDTFDPYRFVGVTGRDVPSHFAFGAGRRSCPGQHMAQRQLCALLGAILSHFRMEKADDTKPLDPLLDVEDPWALASTAPRTRVR